MDQAPDKSQDPPLNSICSIKTLKVLKGEDALNHPLYKCIPVLLHSSKCQDDHCSMDGCEGMKNKMIPHARTCEQRTKPGGCKTCKYMICLVMPHASKCKEKPSCPVPFCDGLRIALEQRKRAQTGSSSSS